MSFGNNAVNQDQYYLAEGSIWFQLLDDKDLPVGDPINIGSCNSADLSFETDSLEIRETQSGSNNIQDRIPRSTDGSISLSVKNFAPETLAFGLYAEEIKTAGETSKVITATAKPGKALLVDGFLKTVDSIVTDGTVTLVEGVHYVVSDSYIEFLEDQGVDGLTGTEEGVTITCSTYAVRSLEAMVKGSVYVRVIFTGVNTARGGAPLRVTAHKVSLDPMQQRGLISIDNEAEVAIQGSLLASRAITGQGLSKLYKEETIDYDAVA